MGKGGSSGGRTPGFRKTAGQLLKQRRNLRDKFNPFAGQT